MRFPRLSLAQPSAPADGAPRVLTESVLLNVSPCQSGAAAELYVSDQERNMTDLENALASAKCVISVMGEHAGEGADNIFDRKIADIEQTGKTFWLVRSPKSRPMHVQKMCETSPGYAIFIEPATKGGARPTTKADAAKEYSHDRSQWHRLPSELSPVTGKLDSAATALVFDALTTNVGGVLDLWAYSEDSDLHNPLKFILGCSTICAVRRESRLYKERMKSRYREIVAVARLKEPFCVWVR